MKKVLRASVVMSFLALAGCDPLAAAGLGSMSFKIDGKDWTAQTGTVTASATAGLNNINITGANNGASETVNSVTIVLTGNAAGTYTLDGSKNTIVMGSGSKNYKNKDTGGGKVELTKFEATSVEGTFDAVLESTDKQTTLNITGGKFTAKR